MFLGELNDEALRIAYSAADVMVVPSRLEAFGQVASEAHACGLPVVVFENTGLTDIVGHGGPGFHAKKNDPVDLAHHIATVLVDDKLREEFSTEAKNKAHRLWREEVIAPAYAEVLRQAVKRR